MLSIRIPNNESCSGHCSIGVAATAPALCIIFDLHLGHLQLIVFLVNAGGRGVIEGLGAQLKLDERQRQPSAQTLYHYGALCMM